MIAFWPLGATDGHAKNFSVFLSSGGRYQMTPLYDVLSARPRVDAHQFRHNKFKLAMAVGDNRHSIVDQIAPSHFIQTAGKSGLGDRAINAIFDELGDGALPAAVKTVESLPQDFPEAISTSILNGIRRRLGSIALWKAAG